MADPAVPQQKENMGQPVPRIDGRAKVTGDAKYASDFATPRPAYAYLVTSSISRGAITSFDDAAVRDMPGILHVMTHLNTKIPGAFKFFGKGGSESTAQKPLADNRVRHDGDIVALIVAENYELAREASYKFKPVYAAETPTATLESSGSDFHEAAKVNPEHEDPKLGDAAGAYLLSEIKINAEYRTPAQHHNPIELFSTTCVWNGDELVLYEPSQWVIGMKFGLARQLDIEPEQIKVVSPFIGGAFGSKGGITQRTALVALAARKLGRPVKLVVTRDQGFTTATYRAETKHQVRMSATAEGKLSSYSHEAWEMTSRTDDYVVGGTKSNVAIYACPNIWTKVHLVKGDRNTPGFMRSPAEVPYMFALECAMDELAECAGIDPVQFRRINETKVNPVTGAAYTSRSLLECYAEGARAFGWEKRSPLPGSMTDGEWLIGWGCATAMYPTQHNPTAVRVRFNADGSIRVQCAAHDVGTGAYTVIGQVAGEWLGQPIEKVKVELGHSDLPPGPVAGGSVTTASVASAVQLACGVIQTKLFQTSGRDSMTALTPDDIQEAFQRLGVSTIEELVEWKQADAPSGAIDDLNKGSVGITGGPLKDRTMFAFGAEFVEVRINQRTREIKAPRIVGAFAAGRIVNPRTARSQLMGGLIWGVSAALHEATEIDPKTARYINDNIADYVMPVNADITDIQVIMVPEVDDKVNPAGVKGLGELGNVGTDAAVANAVYHATGKRIRELPIHIDKLI
ncbi:MAG: xanthine dehydrogenase family protein molybdopterin-binding subunit [Hyphomicrobiales bacterium]|nr:xanthine dehydrogenase family protein molybdopterin-binding subunit [Hyphomicrobiales bacterium]